VTRHFLDLSDFSGSELRAILRTGEEIKSRRRTPAAVGDRLLEGKVVATIFEQPSLRTRVSFDVGIRELGGSPMMVAGHEIELGERETIADTARVLSRYVDAIMIRILDHDSLVEMARYATVPVINGLTKRQHPCQVMADVMTFEQRKGAIEGKRIAWTGDTNNVLTSWVHAAGRLDFELSVATPEDGAPPRPVCAGPTSAAPNTTSTPRRGEAAGAAVFAPPAAGRGGGAAAGPPRHNLLRPYQVDDRLMQRAEKDAIFMHCLPASRGEEVTDAIMDGPQSAVFDEAENRLHAQKGILAWCFGGVAA